MSTCSATCWPRQERHSKAWMQLGSQTNSSLSRFSPGLIGCRPRGFPFFSCPTSDRGKPAVEGRGGAPFHLPQATRLPSPTQTRPRSPTPSSHCSPPPTLPCAPRPLPLLRHSASQGYVAGAGRPSAGTHYSSAGGAPACSPEAPRLLQEDQGWSSSSLRF